MVWDDLNYTNTRFFWRLNEIAKKIVLVSLKSSSMTTPLFELFLLFYFRQQTAAFEQGLELRLSATKTLVQRHGVLGTQLFQDVLAE